MFRFSLRSLVIAALLAPPLLAVVVRAARSFVAPGGPDLGNNINIQYEVGE